MISYIGSWTREKKPPWDSWWNLHGVCEVLGDALPLLTWLGGLHAGYMSLFWKQALWRVLWKGNIESATCSPNVQTKRTTKWAMEQIRNVLAAVESGRRHVGVLYTHLAAT